MSQNSNVPAGFNEDGIHTGGLPGRSLLDELADMAAEDVSLATDLANVSQIEDLLFYFKQRTGERMVVSDAVYSKMVGLGISTEDVHVSAPLELHR